MASSPDYTILSSPRISAAAFAAVLRGGGSPAAPEAAACYQAFVAAGVDPAVGLAIFRKESTYGRFGRAHRNRSWGNIRGSGPYPLDSGHFRIYPSWSAGAADAARLLAIYGSNRIRPGTNTSSVQTFPYVWAPSSDGNAPDRYGDQLAAWIKDWTGNAGTIVNADLTGYDQSANDALSKWQAHLASVGIPNDPDHVFTHDEAVKIVDVLYPTVTGHRVPDRENAIKIFEGHTVRETVSGGSTGIVPTIDPLGPIAAAIGGLAGQLGDVLMHVVILIGILGVIAMGAWLVARSDG